MRLTVKLGGSLLEDERTRQSVLAQVAELRSRHEILLVHGGGKSLSRRLEQLGIRSRFLEGLRVTDGATLGVALMVLAGEVNKTLVAELSRLGVRAMGLCGVDGSSVRCTSLAQIPGAPQGLGFVGKADEVDRPLFELLMSFGLVPVVASIGLGPDNRPYNINADQMASACAAGIRCGLLVYLTDVAGVLDEKGCVLPRLGRSDVLALRTMGTISGGMLPKTGACLEALAQGVAAACILPGFVPDVLLRAVEGNLAEGTSIHDNP